MSESIPVGLQTLLSKHYFLAQITRGYKPCMNNMTLIDSSSWLGAAYRAWYGESRKTVMPDVEKIISETIDSVQTHRNNKEFLSLIINALSETRLGLESMMSTYRSDPDMIGRLKVQLKSIDLQLEKHRHLIKGYGKSRDPDPNNTNNTDTTDNNTINTTINKPEKSKNEPVLLGGSLSNSSSNNNLSIDDTTFQPERQRRRRPRNQMTDN